MTAQTKPTVEGEENVSLVENQYEEEETMESVLGTSMDFTLKHPRVPKIKIQETCQISFCKILKKQIVPCKSTAEEVSFEWSHHRISSTDLKVRTTLHVSIIDSGSERV